MPQGLLIEAAAPHQQGKAGGGALGGDQGPRQGTEAMQGQGSVRRGQVEQFMGDAPPFLEGRLGGADVHPHVDLTGIDRQHPAAETLGEGDAEGGLAAGGGTQQQHQRHGLGWHGPGAPQPPGCTPLLECRGEGPARGPGRRW